MISPRIQTAFTLSEMLFTVTILTILAALLLPALQSARMSGLIAKNLANLRTLQAANIAYASDHDGRFVPSSSWNNEGVAVHWHENPDFRQFYLGIPKSGSWPDKMISPLATLRSATGQRMIVRSYGYNYEALGGISGTPNTVRQAVGPRMASPAEILAFADALDYQIKMSGADLYAGKEEYLGSAVAYRYNGKAGAAFFDGHVEMLPRSQVVKNATLWSIYRQ